MKKMGEKHHHNDDNEGRKKKNGEKFLLFHKKKLPIEPNNQADKKPASWCRFQLQKI